MRRVIYNNDNHVTARSKGNTSMVFISSYIHYLVGCYHRHRLTHTATPNLISDYTDFHINLHKTPSVLIEINHDPASHLSPPQLLHTLRHLAHASDLADRLQQASPRIVESRSGILHGTNKRTDDLQVLEREKVGVGAESNSASGRESDGHDSATDAVADVLDRV